MRKLTALVLALILALAAIPALGEEDYSGSWYLNMAGVTVGSVELNADGTMVYAIADESIEGTWAASEAGVDLTVEDVTLPLAANEKGLANEEEGVYLTREPEKIDLEMVSIYFQAILSGETPELPEGVTEDEMMAALTALLGGDEEEAAEDAEGAAEEAAEAAEEKLEEVAEEAAEEVAEEVTEAIEEKIEETAEETTAEATGEAAAEAAEEAAEERAVISHEEYMAAALEDEVVVYTYVQATQSWWDGKITVYAQSPDGAYFIYNMACSEEDAAKLVPGTAIVVKGYKAEWSGEIEIADAEFVFPDEEYEPFIAEAEDVTAKLGTDELINCQNELVAFKGMTVEAYDETGAAFAYKNAENKTDDLYFKASKDGQTYDFCIEFYLTGSDTEVYKAVEALNVGDVIDMEGFLYWYNGANPHIIKITPAE